MTNQTLAVGLTSRYLVIPVSEHQDTIGSIARTVKDAAYILQAIVGLDVNDNYTTAIPGGVMPDYVAACDASSLRGARLSIPRNVMSLLSTTSTEPIIAAFEKAVAKMRAAGATIVGTDFLSAAEFRNSSLQSQILNADFVVNLQTYLRSLSSNPRNITSLADLQSFTQRHPLEAYPERNAELWDQALQQGWNNTCPEFTAAHQQLLYYGEECRLLSAIERDNLDAVLLPAAFASSWAAPTEAPIITVPMGSYPAGAEVIPNKWGLVSVAPNIP